MPSLKQVEQALKRRWDTLLLDCMEKARELGAADPQVYIEGGSGMVVFDGPSHDDDGRVREEAIIFQFPWPQGHPGKFDCGAW